MNAALPIVGCGAITAVGLSAAQTYTAFRARVAGFEQSVFLAPPAEPVSVARVPASQGLKRSAFRWLVNLADLALRDCIAGVDIPPTRMALLLSLPDEHRCHEALSKHSRQQLMRALEEHVQLRFHACSRTFDDGHAAAIKAMAIARQLLASGDVDACIVGGVDSLLNYQDVSQLRAAGRLHHGDNPQGVIPGEGAAFVCVTAHGMRAGAVPLAQVVGLGAAVEEDTILGERFSTGAALVKALESALRDSGCAEEMLSFRVSDMNGERYRSWESLIGGTRFYRTRREKMEAWYAASCIGDLGAAAGAMSLVLACMGISRGHAPGPFGVCEASSDSGLRAACIVSSALGAPLPPFRSRTGWTQ